MIGPTDTYFSHPRHRFCSARSPPPTPGNGRCDSENINELCGKNLGHEQTVLAFRAYEAAAQVGGILFHVIASSTPCRLCAVFSRRAKSDRSELQREKFKLLDLLCKKRLEAGHVCLCMCT